MKKNGKMRPAGILAGWIGVFILGTPCIQAQERPEIPEIYSRVLYDDDGKLYVDCGTARFYADNTPPAYTLRQVSGNPEGTEKGLKLDFGEMEGSITYGLIPYGKAEHPLPVFRFTRTLQNGKAAINIQDDFKYPYDFVGWKEKGQLTVGYRLMDTSGMIVFDGEVSLSGTGPFRVIPAILEGPFVNMVTENSAVIWFRTTGPARTELEVDGRTLRGSKKGIHHEWRVEGLEPSTRYDYKVICGELNQQYHFTTAPEKGSREPFVFAYTSDSRHATGGGERMIYGANAYIMKKMLALAHAHDAAFLQFTGDMINGYLRHDSEQQLQYTNWKKALEPFWHYMPVYTGMGNHEALGFIFRDSAGREMVSIDGFPFDEFSMEKAFADAFVNPVSDLESEDGAVYDPDPNKTDFPSYRENVYSYTYGNVAMIVLNSDYWYAPSLRSWPFSSGGLHGYLMDNQLDWLKKTVEQFEQDPDIDHVFVTQHTPAFPNGGHSRDDMWYSGNNQYRPYVNGKMLKTGIIERRDQFLDILINHSTKVVGMLTGDEHNYNWLKITSEVPIYPELYFSERLEVSRPLYQINNGAAGAPYYGQEVLPWSDFTQSFSVENALCLFYVDGKKITMKVLNPDTLNQLDEVVLVE